MPIRKVALGLLGGGVIGWLVHGETSKRMANKPTIFDSEPIDPQSSRYKSTPWDPDWDRRSPSSLLNPKYGAKILDASPENIRKVTPTATRHLFFIRHGQYNLEGNMDSERVLTPLGRDQAEATAKRLVDLGYPYTVLIHSSMTRAIETAAIVHKHLPSLPIKQCDLLREGSPFSPEPPLRNWRPDHKFHRDGARVEAAFKRYFHRADPRQIDDSYEIVVCHANVIRYFTCRALQLPPEAWLRMSLNHASVTWFTIRANGYVSVRTLGDSGHMLPGMVTVS